MALLNIIEYPDPRLRLEAEPVTLFDHSVDTLVNDLFATMYASRAIGLSAPQADDRRQILVMDLSGNASEPQVFVNPQIVDSALPGITEEGCLSVPGITARVLRATRVKVRAQDIRGDHFERELEGMHAVCLQHEMDHFAGKLLVDHISFLRRWRVRSAARSRAKATEQQPAG